MIANSAFGAAFVLFLGLITVLSKTAFLAPYKYALVTQHGATIGLFVLVVYMNLFALFYGFARLLFLKDTGHKLHHVDQQLTTPDSAVTDLRRRLLNSQDR
jgi:hypothetical protein